MQEVRDLNSEAAEFLGLPAVRGWESDGVDDPRNGDLRGGGLAIVGDVLLTPSGGEGRDMSAGDYTDRGAGDFAYQTAA